MYEQPSQISLYDLQAMEARMRNLLLEHFDLIDHRIQSLTEKRQATYTIKQFAEATGLSYDCVLQRCQRGKLDARQDGPGTRWIIKGEELDRYLKEASENRW